jgi:hypothetical protein
MAPLPGFPVVSQLSGWWRVAAFAVVAGLYIARLHASIQSTRRRASDGYVDLESSMAQQTGKLGTFFLLRGVAGFLLIH